MKILFGIFFFCLTISAQAKLKVFTTTSNLAAVTQEIGQDLIEVQSLCKGTQDPHFLEAKPSYTFKLSKADLLINVGADLEVGWLPLIIRGSRNPDLREDGKGRLEIAHHLKLLEAREQQVSRSEGDVHPEGNPHFMLSPTKSVEAAKLITARLKQLDPPHASQYQKNFDEFAKKINSKMTEWKKKLRPGLKVISYHKTLTYFYHDFGVKNIDVLEPKPGIPPTASHIMKVISEINDYDIHKIIVENYFDDAVARRVQKATKDVTVHVVPVAVHGSKNVKTIFDLYDILVKMLGES